MSDDLPRAATDLPHSLAGSPRRVALLARPGPACENLRSALQQAGADLVLEDDPSQVDVRALADAAPQVVLVALDTATEDVLSRLDQVLHDPAVTVLYDEAELAAGRQGWEAQRWVRHLAAKLHGHHDVLPPGTEADASQAQPGREVEDVGVADGPGLTLALEPLPGTPGDNPQPAASGSQDLYLDLEPEAWQPRPDPDQAVSDRALPEQASTDHFTGFIPLDADADAPGLAAHEEVPVDEAPAVPATIVTPPAERPGLTLELEALEPVGALQGARGALLLLAGLGGPDAVRKVLADLGPDLPTPVLVCLRLDGGRYDNLVKQLERVTDLPVKLATAGSPALAGHVFVLPDDISLQVQDGVVVFGDGAPNLGLLVASLPAPQTAILLLSGSEPTQVEPCLALAAQGALVAGQALQGCYDPSASKALLARGGDVGTPNELATRVIAHLAP